VVQRLRQLCLCLYQRHPILPDLLKIIDKFIAPATLDKGIVMAQRWIALPEFRPLGLVKLTSEIASDEPRPGGKGSLLEIDAVHAPKVATDMRIVVQRPDRADIFAYILHPDARRPRLFVNLITAWRPDAIRQGIKESRLVEQNFSFPIKLAIWVITAIIRFVGRACGRTYLLEYQ